MKALTRIRGAVTAAHVAILLLAVLAAWSSTLGDRAGAVGVKVGLDFNVATTAANGVYNPGSLPVFETCGQVLTGQQVSIDVFAEDVSTLIAFGSHIQYNQALVSVVAANVNLFMGSQVGSNMVNDSEPGLPDTDGLFTISGHDDGNISGDTGYGVLGRVTFQGVATGTSPVSIPSVDLGGPPALDTGIFLRKADGSLVNDANTDGWYDGPWNPGPGLPAGEIRVGHDNDLDGISSNPCPGGTIDNCPDVAGPQTDSDGDGQGDVCDNDIDGDHYWNNVVAGVPAHEQAMGSNPNNAASKPEVCDGLDNDADGQTDEGYDLAPVNSIADCNDAASNTDGDGQNNTVDTDDDNDGFSDTVENQAGTNSLKKCPVTSADNFWTPDVNNDRRPNISDVVKFGPHFNSFSTGATAAKFNYRFDFNGSNSVTISDIVVMGPVFNVLCTP